MEIKASIKNLRTGPRKVRLLTHGWIGNHPEALIVRLSLQPYKSAEALIKLLKQAIANAVLVHKQEKAQLTVGSIQVGDAFGFKRMDRSHGARFDRGMIKKRGSNVYLTLTTGVVKKSQPALPTKQIDKTKPTTKIVTKIAPKNGSKS